MSYVGDQNRSVNPIDAIRNALYNATHFQGQPTVVSNIIGGEKLNRGIGRFGGMVSPLPREQSLDNPARLAYARQTMMASQPQVTPTPQTRQRVLTPTPTVTPTQNALQPQFKYQDIIKQASDSYGVSLDQFDLLRASENQAEDPQAIHDNGDGTVDVGLWQINVNSNNKAEIQKLMNPVYNTMRAAEIFAQRLRILEDPILALASYNLGAGGAVLRPLDAIKRAEWVYWRAGKEMPETEFTKDPEGYVRKRMDKYRKLGLFK